MRRNPSRDSRREEVSRGKHRASSDSSESDSDFERDEMEEVESPRVRRTNEAGDSLTDLEVKRLRILLDMQMGGTRYPDRATMDKLSITEDVDAMLNNLGISVFMYRRHESYKTATCLFLATLELHLCSPGQFTKDGSDGYITFWTGGARRMLTFKEIDRVHFLPPSNQDGLDVDRGEIDALWGTIASGAFSSGCKSAQIRSPSIRYLHKSLANVLNPRQSTGNVHLTEMTLIDVALTGIAPWLSDGSRLKGSRVNGGITRALIEQLTSYQSWAITKESTRTKCELRMGGLVTPLLAAVGFIPDMKEVVAMPEELDIHYLQNCQFLQRTADGEDLIYQFNHRLLGSARILLPNPSYTSLRGGANVDFNPPPSALIIQSTAHAQPTALDPLTPFAYQHRGIQSPEEPSERLFDFDHFHFEETIVPKTQSAALRAAHERINSLQRWQKCQDKASNTLASKLRKKIKKLRDQVKSLTNMMSCTSSAGVRRTTAPVQTPQPLEISEEEPDHDMTEGLQPPARQPPPDQPRHSSYESRLGKRREREDRAYLRRCATTSRPTGPADHSMPYPTDQYMHQTTAGAGSSSMPQYTQESMDAEIDAIIRGHR